MKTESNQPKFPAPAHTGSIRYKMITLRQGQTCFVPVERLTEPENGAGKLPHLTDPTDSYGLTQHGKHVTD